MRKGIRFSTVAASLSLVALSLAVGGISASSATVHQRVESHTATIITPTVNANYTLNPEAVHLSAQDLHFQTSNYTVAQQLTYIGTTAIHVGNIIVVLTATGPFYGTVVAVNGQTLSTKPATLGDIFEVLDLTVSSATGSASTAGKGAGTGAPALSTSKGANGNSPKGSSLVAESSTGSIQTDPTARSGSAPLLTANCDPGYPTPTVTFNATANAGTFNLQASFSWAGHLKSASITDNPSFTVSMSAAVAGNGTCTLSQDLFDVDLPTIEFVIGWVPVWITQDLSATATLVVTANGSAAINVGYSAHATLGAAKPQGGSWGVIRTGSVTTPVTTAFNITAQATLDVPVTYEAAIYGLAGLSVTADPFAALAVNPPPACKPTPSLKLDGGLKGSIGAFVHLGSLYSWDNTFAQWTFFTTNLIDHLNNCPPITTHLNITTVSNSIHTVFTPGVPAGNTIPLGSTVIIQDVGTASKYKLTLTGPDGLKHISNVKPTVPYNYVLSQSGNYSVSIGGGMVGFGNPTISKQLTITVP
jgi:hypothetical protein